jgi:hypothetical protein
MRARTASGATESGKQKEKEKEVESNSSSTFDPRSSIVDDGSVWI